MYLYNRYMQMRNSRINSHSRASGPTKHPRLKKERQKMWIEYFPTHQNVRTAGN